MCDYLLYNDHNPRKALELAAESTRVVDFKDWWWKARLGKCYYMLGMYRDAERQVCGRLWIELCQCKRLDFFCTVHVCLRACLCRRNVSVCVRVFVCPRVCLYVCAVLIVIFVWCRLRVDVLRSSRAP